MQHVLMSVTRTVRTLEIVAEAGAVRLSDLSVALGTSRPGAFRIAQSLVAMKWLSQGEDRRYRIGPAVHAVARTRETPTPPRPAP